MATTGIEPHSADWQPGYWAVASIPALLLFGFEATQVLIFETTRAPNVSTIAQLALMFAFFGAFVAVPWLVWRVSKTSSPRAHLGIVLRLAPLGLVLSVAHLALLALILRVMHSPPGWGFSHLLNSFFEVWLGNAGLWFIVYAATCGAVLFRLSRDRVARPTSRIEVRQGKRTVMLRVDEIVWIEACGNYVELHSVRGNYLLRKSLDAMDGELREVGFVRSHRRALVNTRHVRSVLNDGRQTYRIELTDNHQAPLSQRRSKQFKRLLSQTSS